MSHRLGISRLRGSVHGDEAGRRNPFAVFRLGHKRSQTKALKVRIALYKKIYRILFSGVPISFDAYIRKTLPCPVKDVCHALQRPGETPAWSGTYEIDGCDYNSDRDLQVTLYDSTPSGAVAIGTPLPDHLLIPVSDTLDIVSRRCM